MLDVAVIGAGFAGLRAAHVLELAGRSVQVIEARERVGGRSRPGAIAGHVVDTGGQWVGAGHELVTALAREAGVALRPQYDKGRKLLQLDGQIRSYRGRIPPIRLRALIELQLAIWRLSALQGRVGKETLPSERLRALDTQLIAEWQAQKLATPESRALFDIALRAVLCAGPEQLTMLHFLSFLHANRSFDYVVEARGGGQASVVQGGMHQLAVYLAGQLQRPLLLSSPVLSVEQSPDDVAIRHGKGELRARRVIVAMAPSMSRKLNMAPACAARDQLGARMPMGSVIKCLVAYERPFWRSRGLSGEFISDSAPFSPTFDASPPGDGCGILVGFVAGADAIRLSREPDVRRREVIASLVAAFGPEAAHPIDYVDHDWIADPWSEGCYMGLPTPGTLTELGTALREPHGRVHWAGTETSARWTGYIEGALCSGDRVAREVLDALR